MVTAVETHEVRTATSAHNADVTPWTYNAAFSRNLGLIGPAEQERLRNARIAIAGQGGVGGQHLITLARLGIGSFTIADPDSFDTANFNRQFGANVRNVGRSKVEVLAEEVLAINPEINLRVLHGPVTEDNVDSFLDGADIYVDGIDFFCTAARRLLFAEAHRRGLWSVTAGPLGFSTAWLTFDPQGMKFDDYFDLHDGMDRLDEIAAFCAGLAPKSTHVGYLDFAHVDMQEFRGPSAGLACSLASGVVGAEIVKILLNRGQLRPAPYYSQFDAYRGVLKHGRIRGGNRHPLQRLRRFFIRRLLQRGRV